MGLATINGLACLVHLICAVLFAVILKDKPIQLFQLKFLTNVPQQSDIDYPQTLVPSSYVYIKWLVVAFFAITAIAHLLYATDFFGAGYYTRAVVGFGWNPFRWLEYSITAGIMLYIISAVAGNKEETSALVSALLAPGLMLQAYTSEREIQQNAVNLARVQGKPIPYTDPYIVWGNFAPSWILYGITWYLIFSAYTKLVKDVEESGEKLQWQVSSLVISQFILFTLFGVIHSIQVSLWAAKKITTSYLPYEYSYIALSFIAKVGLGISVALLLN